MMQSPSEKKAENREIIRRMMEEGASIREMMNATGYCKATVGGVVASIKAEMAEEEHLVFAKHPKPNVPIVEANGKVYQDITEIFLSSEWEGREEC